MINIHKQDKVLQLSGVLDCNTLNQLWSKKTDLCDQVNTIDVSLLTRVDSSGLALLTYFCVNHNQKLISINPQLKTLIELYDLASVLN